MQRPYADCGQWSSVKQEANSKTRAIAVWVSLGRFSRTDRQIRYTLLKQLDSKK
ncbi:MAG: hypothetical protein F6K22_12755 [Okeania sp. SIO2F4]|uniref:hypothetical protein n=1 Tax=Okeania sp. SIO2F4 TaxID=2607790 RepID=UPI00142A513E|nr:hypothetical protein [Okeania sp. SIO2F4]NES03636.1 hypothetical protein [Okeania sp. SIO2F4]